MTLFKTRRNAAATATMTVVFFFLALLPPQEAKGDPADVVAPISDGTSGTRSLGGAPPPANTPQALATVDLSTGAARTRYSFQFPAARGDAQPSLALTYDSSNGVGFAGVSWTLDVPSIVRKGAAGLPLFTDPVLTSPSTLAISTVSDDYLIDGQLLVPICTLQQSGSNGSSCNGTGSALSGELFPAQLANVSAEGWVYFRRQIDDGARYFFSPDGQTWVAQTKSGTTRVFGRPTDSTTFPAFAAAVEHPDPGTVDTVIGSPNAVYRWDLVRDIDATGNNTVYYVWTNNASLLPANSPSTPGHLFLSDIYDTQAATSTDFAHHVHLTWGLIGPAALRFDVPVASPIWQATPIAQLLTVDVTSASFQSKQRQLVRRYSLSYGTNDANTRSYLTAIVMMGTCGDVNPILEDPTGSLPSTLSCPTLPATTYSYYPGTPTGPAIVSGPRMPVPPALLNLSEHPVLTTFSNPVSVAAVADVNGDGRADLVGTTLPDTPLAFTNPVIADLRTFNTASANFRDLPFNWNFNNIAFGDWLSNGRINILQEYALIPGGPQFSNIYTFTITNVNSVGGATLGATTALGPGLPSYIDAQFLADQPGWLSGRSVDLDGDGLTDIALVPSDETFIPVQPVYQSSLAIRDRTGVTQPFGLPTKHLCAQSELDPTFYGPGAVRSLADVDGDGIVDLIIAYKPPATPNVVSFVVFPGRGDGRFGLPLTGSPVCYLDSAGALVAGGPGRSDPIGPDPLSESTFHMGDVNGDGLADYAVYDSQGLHVCLRQGATWNTASFRCASPIKIDFGQSGTFLDFGFADVNGTGVPQVWVNWTDGRISTIDLAWLASDGSSQTSSAPHEGLLQTISNGFGATTTLSYQSVNALGLAKPMPVPRWVVTSSSTTNGLSGSQAQSYATQYGYDNPVYDARDRAFVGFQNVTETTNGDNNSPGIFRKTTFATDACSTSVASTSCVGGLDYSHYRGLRGLVALVEERDGNDKTTVVRTIRNEYQRLSPYAGIDGRRVLLQWIQKRHVYLWDQQTSATSTVSVVQGAQPPAQVSATLPTSGAELLSETDRDVHGNIIDTIDFGKVGSIDQPIITEADVNLPVGDPTGWNWRVTETRFSYLAPCPRPLVFVSCPALPIRTYDYAYYPNGLLRSVSGQLSGSLPLPGPSGQPGDRAARQPPIASADGSSILFANYSYDPYGNLTQATAPNGRCSFSSYDALFQQLPTSAGTYQQGCGGVAMVASRSYDRGLERVTTAVAPSLLTVPPRFEMMRYDGFGRIVELDEPDAAMPGATDANPALKVSYVDSSFFYPNLRLVEFQTVDGPESGAAYADHRLFIDGLGDTLVRLDQAGSPGQTIQYIASGAHTRYSNGRIQQVFQPFYWFSGLPPFNMAYASAAQSFTYDALGRTGTVVDFNNNTTKIAYHPATLSVDIQDPEQLAGGLHAGAKTTIVADGHGRIAKKIVHMVDGAGGDVSTATAYLASGQPQVVTQSTGSTAVTRWMQYDSLGRLVFNAEPNVSPNFSATPNTPGVIGWTYAYDDNGDLVGTSDPRGCGENRFYDGLGHLVGEDYSPCSSTQRPYTQPAMDATGQLTGDGTEAFYSYDGYGQLSSEYDRVRASQYQYDGRGRLKEIARKIATPTGAARLSERYAPFTFTKVFEQYSEADRPTTATTGLDAQGFGTSPASEVTASYTLDGHVQSVTSSYGTLLASQSFDATGFVLQQVLGDQAATTLDMSPYPDESLNTLHVHRAVGPWLTASGYESPVPSDPFPLEYELTNLKIIPDKVGNPLSWLDTATSSFGWPKGSAPLSRKMSYYSDYRLEEVQTTYAGGLDGYVSPYAPEQAKGDATYPQPGQAPPSNRVQDQQFAYDFLGNLTSSTSSVPDDANAFVDRTLGTITNGIASGMGGPHQMQTATSNDGKRSISVSYDRAGNVTSWGPYNGAAPLHLTESGVADLPSWTLGAKYSLGQRVQYQGKPYQCQQPTCVAQSGWEPGSPGLLAIWTGVVISGSLGWAPGLSYSRGDLVSYGNQLFQCIQGHTSEDGWTPDATPALWQPLSATASPVASQVYQYAWDEMGRLASATRYDANQPVVVHEDFAYSAGGYRVLTSRQDSNETRAAHTVNVFDSLVLDAAPFPDANGDYQHDLTTEQLYLGVGGMLLAHASYSADSLPTGVNGRVHVYMTVGDPLGSASFVVDHDTGELVERPSYLPYGAADTDYRQDRWDNFREPVRYTGHRDNAEVGLTYFGARYYAPQLARWMSPDPLTIHRLGADLNPYAFVCGAPTRKVDAVGLDGAEGGPGNCTCFLIFCFCSGGDSGGGGGSGQSGAGWNGGSSYGGTGEPPAPAPPAPPTAKPTANLRGGAAPMLAAGAGAAAAAAEPALTVADFAGATAANDVVPLAVGVAGTAGQGTALLAAGGLTAGWVWLQVHLPPGADETDCEGGTACYPTPAVPASGAGGEPPDNESQTDIARRLGSEGEARVRSRYDIGQKVPIKINGDTRIPDGLTNTTLSEVKNVQTLSYTQQLRDFAQFASQNGLRFDLYVRPGAELSGPLQEAIAHRIINVMYIP
jgi:RHS repeat-associated protein